MTLKAGGYMPMRKSIALLLATALLTGCAGISTTHAAAPSSMTGAPAVVEQPAESPDGLLEAAKRSGTPVVDGTRLTFVYQGNPGDKVEVSGGVNLPLQSSGADGVFVGSVIVPNLDQGIISYALVVNGATIRDPLSKLPEVNAGSALVVYRGPKAAHPKEIDKDPKSPTGQVEHRTIQSAALQEQRDVWVYLPPGFSPDKTYPTLLVADAQLYFGPTIHLTTVLDNLIAEKKIPPVAAIGVSSIAETRLDEYIYTMPRFDAYQTFVRRELLPWAESEFKLSPSVGEMVPLGMSNGGAWAFYTALIEPDRFGGAILQSALTTISAHPALPSGKRFYVSAGTLDPNAVTLQGQFQQIFEQDNKVKTNLGVGGHDGALAETQLVEGLTWVLGK